MSIFLITSERLIEEKPQPISKSVYFILAFLKDKMTSALPTKKQDIAEGGRAT